MKNIIFICTANKKPYGGNKIIYQYSNLIHSLKGYNSSIIHIKKNKLSKIITSVKKTGRLLALDTGVRTGSIAGEIIARVSIESFDSLIQPPERITLPDFPTPTSSELTRDFYRRTENIIDVVSNMLGRNLVGNKLINRGNLPHDVPGEWFKGPF